MQLLDTEILLLCGTEFETCEGELKSLSVYDFNHLLLHHSHAIHAPPWSGMSDSHTLCLIYLPLPLPLLHTCYHLQNV